MSSMTTSNKIVTKEDVDYLWTWNPGNIDGIQSEDDNSFDNEDDFWGDMERVMKASTTDITATDGGAAATDDDTTNYDVEDDLDASQDWNALKVVVPDNADESTTTTDEIITENSTAKTNTTTMTTASAFSADFKSPTPASGMKKKAYAKGGKVAMYNQGGMVKSTGTIPTGINNPKNTYK